MDPISLGLAGAGLAGTLFSGFQAAQQRKKLNKQIRGMEAENKAFYNSQALGDFTQRADAQNAIRMMRNQLDRQTKRATNTAAITGGTIEQAAVSKDSANKALADATANIGAVGAQFKDRVTDRYLRRKDNLNMLKLNQTQNAASGWENLMQTSLNTGAGALSSVLMGAGGGSMAGLGAVGNVAKGVNTSATKNVSGIIPKYTNPFK